jgi:anti-sigma B factor antagonist
VSLVVNSRRLGDVVLVQCAGRITAGEGCTALHRHITALQPDEIDIVLQLAEVTHVDSSGAGMLVRLLTRMRSVGGDLKLASLSAPVARILEITNLISLFDTHTSELDAISAFYRAADGPIAAAPTGIAILCIHESNDVLAYMREILRYAGYKPVTSGNLHDAGILLRASRPKLLIISASLQAAASKAFLDAARTTSTVILNEGFSAADAAEAAREILNAVRTRVQAIGA